MNDKLTYKPYKNCKDIITIDLHNNYTVIAIKSWNIEKHNYVVELHLKKNRIDKWDLIDEFEFDADYKTINAAILKQVATFLKDGFFDYYIQRYEYYLNCFDIGNELYEKESLGDK